MFDLHTSPDSSMLIHLFDPLVEDPVCECECLHSVHPGLCSWTSNKRPSSISVTLSREGVCECVGEEGHCCVYVCYIHCHALAMYLPNRIYTLWTPHQGKCNQFWSKASCHEINWDLNYYGRFLHTEPRLPLYYKFSLNTGLAYFGHFSQGVGRYNYFISGSFQYCEVL